MDKDEILTELLNEMRETRKDVVDMKLEFSEMRGDVNTRLAEQSGKIATATDQVATHKMQIGWLYGLFGVLTIGIIVKLVTG